MVSVIGPNGAGKTTLFNLISGHDAARRRHGHASTAPTHRLAPERLAALGLARTFQHGRVFAQPVGARQRAGRRHTPPAPRPPAAAAGLPVSARCRTRRGAAAPARGAPPRRPRCATRRARSWHVRRPPAAPAATSPRYSLSYANRRRVEIARALALRPRLLLLDEPTAGMNETETAEMQAIIAGLKARGQTILLIEHKLDLVHAAVRPGDRDGRRQRHRRRLTRRRCAPTRAVIEAYLGHRH